MKQFFATGFVLVIICVILTIAPFLTIWGLNTLFQTGISHGIWEYLAVWALLLVWKPEIEYGWKE